MRKNEVRGANAVEMTAAAVLGGLLALGVAMTVLLLGAAAVSNGILKQDVTVQITALACVLGGLCGGVLTCLRWRARCLPGGLAAGGVCFLLILAVGLLSGDEFSLGLQAFVELAGCFCGGGLAGVLCGGRLNRRRPGARKK